MKSIASDCHVIVNQNEQIIGKKDDIWQSEKSAKKSAIVLRRRQTKVDDFNEEVNVGQNVACEHSEEENVARLTSKVLDSGNGIRNESVECEADEAQKTVTE